MLGTGEQTLSKEMKIEVITYEQERLDFFTKAMQLAQKRYNRLFKIFKDDPYLSEGTTIVSDAGRETQFYHDVVEMLEKGNRKQSEGEWRGELVERCDWRGKKQQYFQPNSCSVCHTGLVERTPYCPICGAKMKGGAE